MVTFLSFILRGSGGTQSPLFVPEKQTFEFLCECACFTEGDMTEESGATESGGSDFTDG